MLLWSYGEGPKENLSDSTSHIYFLVIFCTEKAAWPFFQVSIILAIHINRRRETVLMPKYSLILGIQLTRKHVLAF